MIHRSGAFGDSAGVHDALIPSESTFDQASETTLALLRRAPRREGNAIGANPAFDNPADDYIVCVPLNVGLDEASGAAFALYPLALVSWEASLRRKERATVAVTTVDWGDWSPDKGWLQSEPVQSREADDAATWVVTCRMEPIGDATELGWAQSTYPHGELAVEPGPINAWLLEPPEPSLLARSRGTLTHLMALEEGWDGYDGLPMLPRVAEHTELFLEQVEAYTSIAPELVPLPNGGVQLEWYIGEVEIEVEIEPDGTTTILFECRSDGQSEEIGLGGSLDLSPVADFFRELPP